MQDQDACGNHFVPICCGRDIFPIVAARRIADYVRAGDSIGFITVGQ